MSRAASRRRLARRCTVLVTVWLLLATLLTTATTVPVADPAGAAVAMQLTGTEGAQLQRLNDWRAARGLSRLQIDPVTQQQARAWSASMAARRTLGHSPSSHADCQAASRNCVRWAENVGYSTSGEAGVFNAFVNSAGHANNMRSTDVDRVGVGVFTDGRGYTWVTQRFIKCGCTNDATANAANAQRSRDRSLVTALYPDFLKRWGSGAEVNHYVDLLAYLPRDGVVASFASSNEWVGALIDSYYWSTLGRGPDPSGRNYWIGVYHRGSTPAQIAAYFYASQEFFNRSGGSNRAWVTALYREILGRNPESGGLNYWTGLADRGTSRSSIAYDFYQSVESRQDRVISLYGALLGRYPDPGGLDYWVNVLHDGRDVALAINLATSAEYGNRAAARFP